MFSKISFITPIEIIKPNQHLSCGRLATVHDDLPHRPNPDPTTPYSERVARHCLHSRQWAGFEPTFRITLLLYTKQDSRWSRRSTCSLKCWLRLMNFLWVHHGFSPFALHFQVERVTNHGCNNKATTYLFAGPLGDSRLFTCTIIQEFPAFVKNYFNLFTLFFHRSCIMRRTKWHRLQLTIGY